MPTGLADLFDVVKSSVRASVLNHSNIPTFANGRCIRPGSKPKGPLTEIGTAKRNAPPTSTHFFSVDILDFLTGVSAEYVTREHRSLVGNTCSFSSVLRRIEGEAVAPPREFEVQHFAEHRGVAAVHRVATGRRRSTLAGAQQRGAIYPLPALCGSPWRSRLVSPAPIVFCLGAPRLDLPP